jgi:hypothetical protein
MKHDVCGVALFFVDEKTEQIDLWALDLTWREFLPLSGCSPPAPAPQGLGLQGALFLASAEEFKVVMDAEERRIL